MTIEELRWMTKLFETRNMSRAAETLFVSQPALSQCVRRIEEQLGFKLFSRSNKGLEPTEKGLLFAEAAESITRTYQNFLTRAELSDQQTLGEIAIGLPPFLSSCCSAELIDALSAHFPQTRFSVLEGSWDALVEALRANEIQLVYTSGPLELPGVKVYPFGRGELVLILRRGSSLAAQVTVENGVRTLDPRLLREEPLAMTKPGQATRRLAENLLKEAGIPAAPCRNPAISRRSTAMPRRASPPPSPPSWPTWRSRIGKTGSSAASRRATAPPPSAAASPCCRRSTGSSRGRSTPSSGRPCWTTPPICC